jgi:hypothetical protein
MPANGDDMEVTGSSAAVGEGEGVCVSVGVFVGETVKVGVFASTLAVADGAIVGVGAGAQAANKIIKNKAGRIRTVRAGVIKMVDSRLRLVGSYSLGGFILVDRGMLRE